MATPEPLTLRGTVTGLNLGAPIDPKFISGGLSEASWILVTVEDGQQVKVPVTPAWVAGVQRDMRVEITVSVLG